MYVLCIYVCMEHDLDNIRISDTDENKMKTKWKENEKMKNIKKWKISLESSPEWEGLFFPGEAHDFKASLGYPSGYQPNSMDGWGRGVNGKAWPPGRVVASVARQGHDGEDTTGETQQGQTQTESC